MIKSMDLVFACFYLFLIVCYLALLWIKDFSRWISILLVKLGFKPIFNSVPEFNEQENHNYQNPEEYPKNHGISPRMFIEPVFDNSPNYGDNYQAHNYCQSSALLLFRHFFYFFPKLCIRVYHLLRRSQPKGNDTENWVVYHFELAWSYLQRDRIPNYVLTMLV